MFQQIKEYYPDGGLKCEYQVDTLNRKQGEYKSYYEHGQLESKMTYMDGILQGTHQLYRENGSLKQLSRYNLGVLTEEVEKFSKNGKKKRHLMNMFWI